MSTSSVADESYTPPRIELRQFDPSHGLGAHQTGRLVDTWHALQRSSVDAALLPPSERNIFAFAVTCLYFATVHDLDFRETPRKTRVKEQKEEKIQELTKVMREGLLQTAQGPLTRWKIESSGAGSALGSVGVVNVPQAQDHDMDEQSSLSGAHQPASTTWINENKVMEDFASQLELEENAYKLSGDRFDIPDAQGAAPNPFIDVARFVEDEELESEVELESDLIGIAYLAPAAGRAAEVACEVSLGLALLPHARGKGFGSETVRSLLKIAIDDLRFHRVSAGVLGPSPSPRPALPPTGLTPDKEKSATGNQTEEQQERLRTSMNGTETETEAALRMFVGLGFVLEGTRRRSVTEADDSGAWRDAYYLAMLDTDWLAIQARVVVARPPSKGKGKRGAEEEDGVSSSASGRRNGWMEPRRTRWDEMLARHQREQEALAGVESRLQRSASTETLRPGAGAGAKDELVEVEIGGGYVTSSASESDYGRERERASISGSPSSTRSSLVKDPFRDPSIKVSISRPRSRFFFSTNDESANEASHQDESLSLYESQSESDPSHSNTYYTGLGEQAQSTPDAISRAKVAQFLRTHPHPGPPPSEVDLGSSVESDFESCADELDFLSEGEGAKAAGSTNAGTSADADADVGCPAGSPLNASTTATSSANPNLDLNLIQARKKRRLSLDEEVDRTNTGDVDASAPENAPVPVPVPAPTTPPHTSPRLISVHSLESVPPLNFRPRPLRGTNENANTNSHVSSNNAVRDAIRDANADTDIDTDTDTDAEMHSDHETSDVETISTSSPSTSTWDILSGGGSVRALSPSPSPSPSPSASPSFTSVRGSLSLQSVSGSEDEQELI